MLKHIIWIAVLISLVYTNALMGGFVYDDYLVVVDNDFVKTPANLKLFFSRRYLTHPLEAAFNQGAYNIGSGEASYRPLPTLTYFLNYALFKLDPFGYRLTNLGIHILCAILLYLLLNIIFAQPQFAFFAAVIFGIHPVNAEVVNCTAFRPNSLAALFCLLAIILYLKFKNAPAARKYYCLAGSLVSAFLAVLSKEVAVFLPLAIILCEYYRSKVSLVKLLKDNGKVYLLYFGVDLVYALVYFLMVPPTQRILGQASLATNFVRMFNILGLYLQDIVFPKELVLIDPMAIFNSWPLVILGIVVSLAAGYVVFKKNKFSPGVSFGVIWFLLWLLPVNNFLSSFRILAAYRFLYLPIMGAAVILGLALDKFRQQKTKTPLLQKLAPLAGYIYLAIFCISANASWKNNLMLNISLVGKNPKSIFAHLSLGNTLSRYGDYSDAKKEYAFVLSQPDLDKYNPLDLSIGYCNLGAIYILEGKYAKAEEQYLAALKLTPHLAHIYARLGYCYARAGQYEKALDYLNQAKKINPRFSPAYLNMGITYMVMEKYDEARREFNQALEIAPNYQQVRDNLKKLDSITKGQK